MGAIVFIDRPHVEIALKYRCARAAEKWPDAACLFAGPMGEDHKGPGRANFGVVLFPIDRARVTEWPKISRRVALGRSQQRIERQDRSLLHGIVGADAGRGVEIKRPEHKELVVAAHQFSVAPGIRSMRDLFMLAPHDRPELPSFESFAVAQMENGVNVIVRDEVALSRLDVNGHKDEMHFFPEQPVLECAINWEHGGVILFLNRRALLEIDRK